MLASFVSITGAANGDALAAVAGRTFYVHGIIATATAVQNFTLRSGTTAISGNHRLGANSVVVLPYCGPEDYYFKTAAGEALNIIQDTATNVGEYTVFYSYNDA